MTTPDILAAILDLTGGSRDPSQPLDGVSLGLTPTLIRSGRNKPLQSAEPLSQSTPEVRVRDRHEQLAAFGERAAVGAGHRCVDLGEHERRGIDRRPGRIDRRAKRA